MDNSRQPPTPGYLAAAGPGVIVSTEEVGMARAVGRGYSLNVYIRTDQEWLRQALEKMAAAESRSLSEIIMRILEHHVVAAQGPGVKPAA